jgi:hypothetical protein
MGQGIVRVSGAWETHESSNPFRAIAAPKAPV